MREGPASGSDRPKTQSHREKGSAGDVSPAALCDAGSPESRPGGWYIVSGRLEGKHAGGGAKR